MFNDFTGNNCQLKKVDRMSDIEAVSALLMLSNGIPEMNEIEPQDLSIKRDCKSNIRLLPPIIKENANIRQFGMNPILKYNFNEMRTSSPICEIKSSNLYEDFSIIKDSPESLYSNNHFIENLHQIKQNGSPTDSGHSSSFIDDAHISSPVLAIAMTTNSNNLPYAVKVELEKIERGSSHIKENFIKEKLEENPVYYEYNPSKSRLRKVYDDPSLEAGRAKNNMASRKSRYKKKLASRLLSINYDYDIIENRKLYQQEQWMLKMIKELEQIVLQNGYDINVIKDVRSSCGLK